MEKFAKPTKPQDRWRLQPYSSFPTPWISFQWKLAKLGYKLCLYPLNAILLLASIGAEYCSAWHDHYECQLESWAEIKQELDW